MILGALVLVLVQAAVGMVVNLYVTIPARHSGAHASDYLTGSFHSIVWAIGSGATGLAIHASLGLLLVLMAISVAVRATETRPRAVLVWSIVAGLLIIGAGFNGASFLDYGHNVSSLIMALLAFGAAASYAVALFLV